MAKRRNRKDKKKEELGPKTIELRPINPLKKRRERYSFILFALRHMLLVYMWARCVLFSVSPSLPPSLCCALSVCLTVHCSLFTVHCSRKFPAAPEEAPALIRCVRRSNKENTLPLTKLLSTMLHRKYLLRKGSGISGGKCTRMYTGSVCSEGSNPFCLCVCVSPLIISNYDKYDKTYITHVSWIS